MMNLGKRDSVNPKYVMEYVMPDLLGVKKQKKDVDRRKENDVSLQMTMTAKKMRI